MVYITRACTRQLRVCVCARKIERFPTPHTPHVRVCIVTVYACVFILGFTEEFVWVPLFCTCFGIFSFRGHLCAPSAMKVHYFVCVVFLIYFYLCAMCKFSFIYSFVHSFIHSFIYSFIQVCPRCDV